MFQLLIGSRPNTQGGRGVGVPVLLTIVLVGGIAGPTAAYQRPGRITWVSLGPGGQEEGQVPSQFPSVSADGRFVAFQSRASNLVAGLPGDTNGDSDVFIHDREKGTTERVSVASDGSQRPRHSQAPSISADGRYLAFESSSELAPEDRVRGPRISTSSRRPDQEPDGTRGRSA